MFFLFHVHLKMELCKGRKVFEISSKKNKGTFLYESSLKLFKSDRTKEQKKT